MSVCMWCVKMGYLFVSHKVGSIVYETGGVL